MISYNFKQTGGTLLGIIIGLVFGLSIAVLVAVMISKTPIPFINRPIKDKIFAPTADSMGDPNKSLYGNKEAAKEAAKEFARKAEPAVPAALPAAKAAAVKPAENDDAKAPAADKAADAKEGAKDGAKEVAAKTDGAEDKVFYYLQVGAFREQNDAESVKAKLALLGFETRISERPSESGALLYRVRVGPLAQAEAMKVRSKLSDNGVDVAVVRTTK